MFARAIRKQAYSKAACICECEMQVLSSQKQITKCESTAFSGTRFPFDRYAGFHYSGFTVYFAPVYSCEYSGQKKPLVRNGGNCNTDFKETILIVLFFAQFRMLGPRGILNHVRASHSQTSIFKGGMYMRMRDFRLIPYLRLLHNMAAI